VHLGAALKPLEDVVEINGMSFTCIRAPQENEISFLDLLIGGGSAA
jgi:hypothetical protein|tara:strand:+ start:621 stop:758 length:138 start_codon:yes stop_codon:yes gene_type:complete